MEKVIERFLSYVKYDTQSLPDATTYPSTDKQLAFARVLLEEVKQIGLVDAEMDQYGYVTATLPSNMSKKVSTIAFLAHMDTADQVSGTDVKPQIVKNYDGGTIVLNSENNITLSPEAFPELLNYKGQDIITTDGTTLLGADDKAGIAEILSAMEYLIQHPEIQHGTVRIGFTPDEEVGTGVEYFDVAKFNADFAFTVDGGEVGELEYENFNGASAKIWISGRSVHTGYAKNKMINALDIAMELHKMLPPQEAPAFTEGYEGFYHLDVLNGSVEEAHMSYILRDHDKIKFAQRKERMEKIVAYLNEKYGSDTIKLELKDSYYNMREMIEPYICIIDMAKEAMEKSDVKPIVRAIRGGTDGARLSYKGLPTPNIFTGGHNFHGKYEFIPIPSMQKAMAVIIKMVELVSSKYEL